MTNKKLPCSEDMLDFEEWDKQVHDSSTILGPDGNKVVLAPDEEWIPGGHNKLSCTCGIEAIGGGLHSDYCDLYRGDK